MPDISEKISRQQLNPCCWPDDPEPARSLLERRAALISSAVTGKIQIKNEG